MGKYYVFVVDNEEQTSTSAVCLAYLANILTYFVSLFLEPVESVD